MRLAVTRRPYHFNSSCNIVIVLYFVIVKSIIITIQFIFRVFVLAILFCFNSVYPAIAQDKKNYELSPPVEVPSDGWNRLILMHNGSTLLFHFDPEKFITVWVFDSARKQSAKVSDHYRYLDRFGYEEPVFKGLFEINGEAVLFIEQEVRAKHCLIRLRYSAITGNLTEEKLLGESENTAKRIKFYVIKNKQEENYEVFFCTDNEPLRKCDLYVVCFNNLHQSVKEVQLDVDRKKYDYLTVLGAASQPAGIMITLGLDKTVQFGIEDHDVPIVEGGAIYDHNVQFYFIPKDSSRAFTQLFDLSVDVFPKNAFFTQNTFAGSLNTLLYNSHAIHSKFGLNEVLGDINSCLFFKMDEQAGIISYCRIKDSLANAHLHKNTDTSRYFSGRPQLMRTNENGLSTIVSIAAVNHLGDDGFSINNSSFTTYSIGVTMFDDDGKELWGTVMPIAQIYNQYQKYKYHFRPVYTYSDGNNSFAVFNDYEENFSNTFKNPGLVINSFENTSACYYKITRKREVVKKYVFSKPVVNEHISCFMDATFFDEKTGDYAALVQYKRGDDTSIRMAWSKLE